MKYIGICLVLCTGSVLSASLISKCKVDDSKCLTASFQAALPKILSGIPELGVESSDPLYMDLIESKQPMLNTTYTKVTVNGYKNCEIKDVRFTPQKSLLNYDLFCTVDMSGDYVIKGKLLVIPIEGDGKFTIDAKKMLLSIEAETKEVVGSDGKKHLNIKNFKLEIDALDTVKFNFTNLFNGNQQLANGVIMFANQNYRDVTREVAPPFFNANLRKMFKNLNKYLKTVPIEEMLVV